jgi:hypothetical protein
MMANGFSGMRAMDQVAPMGHSPLALHRRVESHLFKIDLLTDHESGIPGGVTPPSTAGETPAATEARFMKTTMLLWVLVILGLGSFELHAAEAPDAPLEGLEGDPFVAVGQTGLVSAAFVDRRLRVEWNGATNLVAASTDSAVPRVLVSTDAPGHWPVRDWRSWPMTGRPGAWEARIPLVSAATPVVYFVEASGAGVTNASSMRWFRPRLAGVTEPTLPFTGHLEGFEQGLAGWEWGGSGDGSPWMTVSSQAWSGRGALRMEVPSGRASATVGTVRVRGWMLAEHAPRQVVVVARTERGAGRIRMALHGDARSPQLAVFPAKSEFEVGTRWRRVEVPLDSFVNLRPSSVDWLTIQFLAESGRAVLLDDLELELR